jgi:hypothetical protein
MPSIRYKWLYSINIFKGQINKLFSPEIQEEDMVISASQSLEASTGTQESFCCPVSNYGRPSS